MRKRVGMICPGGQTCLRECAGMGYRMRMYELREKEVVNICDCRRIGCVGDVEIDECGCVCAIIVPECGRFCGLFGREHEYVIPWKCIRQIGSDIILVEVCLEDVFVKCRPV